MEALLARAVWPTDVGTALLFENEWCRAWDFTFPPGGGDDRAVHQHCLDYVFCFPCGGTAGQWSGAVRGAGGGRVGRWVCGQLGGGSALAACLRGGKQTYDVRILSEPRAARTGLRSARCRLIGTNPDGSQQFDSRAVDGDVIWQPVPNGGFDADGRTPLQQHRHGGRNGLPDKPFVEYLIELK